MEWRLNRYCLLSLLFAFVALGAQNDSSYVYPNENFDPNLHFDAMEKDHFKNLEFVPVFDSIQWKKLIRGKSYQEEIDTPKKKKNSIHKKEKTWDFSPSLKYMWLLPVLLILGILLLKFIPLISQNNIKNRHKLIIQFDDLDEDAMRTLETEDALKQALKNRDFRFAYRLRYLEVLKQLIDKNLIVYRKEKTNYEYLMQLNGKAQYEPFRLLTFSFDGIWYGDMQIDEALYHSLSPSFIQFEESMKRN